MSKPTRTRKQHFFIALAVAGMTAKRWCQEIGEVTPQHLCECWRREADPTGQAGRKMSDRLRGKLDRFIKEQGIAR